MGRAGLRTCALLWARPARLVRTSEPKYVRPRRSTSHVNRSDTVVVVVVVVVAVAAAGTSPRPTAGAALSVAAGMPVAADPPENDDDDDDDTRHTFTTSRAARPHRQRHRIRWSQGPVKGPPHALPVSNLSRCLWLWSPGKAGVVFHGYGVCTCR